MRDLHVKTCSYYCRLNEYCIQLYYVLYFMCAKSNVWENTLNSTYRQMNFGPLCNSILCFSAIVIATNEVRCVIQSMCELSYARAFDLSWLYLIEFNIIYGRDDQNYFWEYIINYWKLKKISKICFWMNLYFDWKFVHKNLIIFEYNVCFFIQYRIMINLFSWLKRIFKSKNIDIV